MLSVTYTLPPKNLVISYVPLPHSALSLILREVKNLASASFARWSHRLSFSPTLILGPSLINYQSSSTCISEYGTHTELVIQILKPHHQHFFGPISKENLESKKNLVKNILTKILEIKQVLDLLFWVSFFCFILHATKTNQKEFDGFWHNWILPRLMHVDFCYLNNDKPYYDEIAQTKNWTH